MSQPTTNCESCTTTPCFDCLEKQFLQSIKSDTFKPVYFKGYEPTFYFKKPAEGTKLIFGSCGP